MKDIINLDVVTEVVEQGGQKLVSLDVDALSRYLDTEDIPKAWTLGVQITFPYTG